MKKEELSSIIESYCIKYGEKKDNIENGLEYLALHLIAQQKEFTEFYIEGHDPFEVDLSDSRCAGADDLRIDGLLVSEDSTSVAIIQAAHRTKYGKELDDKASGFFNSVEDWVDNHKTSKGNLRVQSLLRDADLMPSKQQITLYFFTTLSIGSDSAKSLINIAQNAKDKYVLKGWNIDCQVLGAAEITEKHIELGNIRDYGLPIPLKFKIQKDFFFEIKEPLKVLVCGIKANQIADIYNNREVKNRLFNQNVRLPLQTKINQEISKTATNPEQAPNFFYYNNGITATCSEYILDGNEITANHLQVVNGAQTVMSLARSVGGGGAVKKSTEAVVLFRLIETGETNSRKSELADNITRYQNTQNVVKESDFFSNEEFQIWLSKNLSQQLSNHGIIPAFYYQHKRGFKPSSATGEPITIEKLAQLRHAIYYGPSTSYNGPKVYWDRNEKAYWEAFGHLGVECSIWNQQELDEIGWAIATYLNIIRIGKTAKKENKAKGITTEEATYLTYLSRYVTSVAFQVTNVLVKNKEIPNFGELISSRTMYAQYSDPIIKDIRRMLTVKIKDMYGLGGNSRLYLARDVKVFENFVSSTVESIQSGLITINK
jgi:hypothetical protein